MYIVARTLRYRVCVTYLSRTRCVFVAWLLLYCLFASLRLYCCLFKAAFTQVFGSHICISCCELDFVAFVVCFVLALLTRCFVVFVVASLLCRFVVYLSLVCWLVVYICSCIALLFACCLSVVSLLPRGLFAV